MLEFIARRDRRLMYRVHRWEAPKWVRLWMVYATRGGSGWLWFALGVAVLLFGGPGRYEAIGAAALAGALSIVLFLWLKRVTDRRRPCELEPHCWADLLPPDRFSFPSGHSITAFSFATPLGLFYPSLMLGLMFCAVSIAISRIILGMHFLSDVVVGSLLGLSLGYGAYLVFV